MIYNDVKKLLIIFQVTFLDDYTEYIVIKEDKFHSITIKNSYYIGKLLSLYYHPNGIELTLHSLFEKENDKFIRWENNNITCELGFRHPRIKVYFCNNKRIKSISYYKNNKLNGFMIEYDVYHHSSFDGLSKELKYNITLRYYRNQTLLKFEITDLEKVSELLLDHREDLYNDEYEKILLNYVVFT